VDEADVRTPAAVTSDGLDLAGALARLPEAAPVAIIVTNAAQALAELETRFREYVAALD
jgi:hypothetical protein